MLEFALVLAFVLLGLLFSGIKRKLLARMHNRIGPPIIQPFYDMLKLFSKERGDSSNPIFSLAPWLSLLCAFAILFLVSVALVGSGSAFGFDYDFILLGYLFILLDTFYIFGAVASRNPFAIQSSVRELLLMLGYEVTFIMVLLIFFSKTGALSLAAYDAEYAFTQLPLASLLTLLVGFVIVRITPFDVVNAYTEISAGFFTEYYGRDLALIEIAEFAKDLAFFITAALLVVGRAYAIPVALVLLFLYTFMQATSPRYCTFRSAKIFLVIAIIAFIDLFFLV